MSHIKILFLFFSLLLLGCSPREREEVGRIEQVEVSLIKTIDETKDTILETNFQKLQDSLRMVLLDSKQNESLKSSLIQELYIRGLAVEEKDKISIDLPFNLHTLDCGAPDCYSTDLSFKIHSSNPIEFPEKIDIRLHEHGCIDKEVTIISTFSQKEKSYEHINYFSDELRSNLIIKKSGKLYYYPHMKSNSISVKTIDEMFENGEFDDEEVTPYQSTVMISNEYEH